MRHIIAACWNKAEITERFLESFLRSSREAWSLILVDNGSTDSTPALLRSYHGKIPNLRILTSPTNEGCAAAWNKGIRQAQSERSELIGILNNDLVFADGWDTSLLRFAQEHAQTYPIFSPHTLRCELESFERQAQRFMHRNAHRIRRKMGSEAMFFLPEVFTRVGLFDERYFVSYEDTDYYVRAMQAGIPSVVTGASVLWHREKTTRGDMGSQHEINARAKFIEKWGSLDILRSTGWVPKSRWVIRYWRWRERLGLL
ncbi:MAG: glycosyltransferase [Bdellovibrionales bacterium]|nr:glycosyltransferase [Bdellovibrionales bacterium]